MCIPRSLWISPHDDDARQLTYKRHESLLLVLDEVLLSGTDPKLVRQLLRGVVLLVRELAPEMVAPEFPKPRISAIYLWLPVFVAISGFTIGQRRRRSKAQEVLIKTWKLHNSLRQWMTKDIKHFAVNVKKWAILGLFFVYFRIFKQTLKFLQQINVKKWPSRTRCRDSNSQTFITRVSSQ